MARGRMISKSLSTSRKYGLLYREPLGEFCQSLYPLLVVHADDFGRMQSDTYTIKHGIVPASPRSEAEIEEALALLERVGLIRRNCVAMQIVDFEEHQTGLHKRTASKFPEIPGNSRSREEKRREEKGTEEKRTEKNNNKLVSSNGNGHHPQALALTPVDRDRAARLAMLESAKHLQGKSHHVSRQKRAR